MIEAKPAGTEPDKAFEFAEGRGFDELDMIEAARDYEAAHDDAIIAARDEDVANTLIDWRDEQASEAATEPIDVKAAAVEAP